MTRFFRNHSDRCANLFAVWIALFISATTFASTTIRDRIESAIKTMLEEQLEKGEFYVYAIVENDTTLTDSSLPYTGLSVSQGTLDSIIAAAFPNIDMSQLRITVKVGLDRKIPSEKRQILTRMITERFAFDNVNKKLMVEVASLVNKEPSNAELLALERARILAEGERLKTEAERMKLDAARQELEAAKKAKPTAVINMPKDEAPEEKPAEEAPLQQAPFTLFKDYQLSAAALIIGLVAILCISIFGFFFVRGIKPLATALTTIGTSLDTSDLEGTQSGSEQSTASSIANLLKSTETTPEVDPKTELLEDEYIRMIEEKINVLSTQGNYGFIRTLNDFISDRKTISMAAGVLTSLPEETLKVLASQLPIDSIQAVINSLETSAGLAKARSERRRGLAELYSRISVDEFYGSPLSDFNSVSWLSRMSNEEIASFSLGLSESDRSVFLSLLSPARVRLILEEISGTEREKMLVSIATIPKVSKEQMAAFLEEFAEKQKKGLASGGTNETLSRINSVRYFISIADSLSNAEREQLLQQLSANKQVVRDIRKSYVPFSDIVFLKNEEIGMLLESRSVNDIATLLIDATLDIRTKVVASLPPIRRDIVNSEIETLTNDSNIKLIQRRSRQMQSEICKTMLSLRQAGIIEFDYNQQDQTTTATTQNIDDEDNGGSSAA